MISPPKFPRAFLAILAFFLIPSIAAHAASLVAAVTAGTWHSVFIQTDGSLWATGHNAYGQTGDGTTTDRSIPFQITTGVTAACGSFVAMAGTQTVTSIDAQWERVTVQEPAPPATAPSAFARVQVSLP